MTAYFAGLSRFGTVELLVWWFYLLAAVMLPAYHVQPILRYLRGSSGIGDACLRTEVIQCGWRVPALLSIALDMLGRIGRILAMRASHRRWLARTPSSRLTGPSMARGPLLVAATQRS